MDEKECKWYLSPLAMGWMNPLSGDLQTFLLSCCPSKTCTILHWLDSGLQVNPIQPEPLEPFTVYRPETKAARKCNHLYSNLLILADVFFSEGQCTAFTRAIVQYFIIIQHLHVHLGFIHQTTGEPWREEHGVNVVQHRHRRQSKITD